MAMSSALKNIGSFLAVTVPLGAAGGLLLYGISEFGTKCETVYTYDENGEKHVRRVRYRPLVWLYAFLEWFPFPWSRVRRQRTSCDKSKRQTVDVEPEFTEGEPL